MRASQPRGVCVIREPQDWDVRIGLGDVRRVDACNIRNNEIGWLDPIRGLEAMPGQSTFQLAPDEQVDPYEQDRRHG